MRIRTANRRRRRRLQTRRSSLNELSRVAAAARATAEAMFPLIETINDLLHWWMARDCPNGAEMTPREP